MIRIVPTGDLGLDVLTGGGWRLVKRFEERESACVVVRGGPGAGKSTLGIHVALELANALGGDVAVGCVEILPTEYVAQLQSTRPSLAAARIVQLPAQPAPLAEGGGPRVFIGLMTELDPARPDLAANLAALGAAVEAAGGKPTVFIVDSLIDGYGIGSSINRIDADATIKFAVQGGYGLVLCEETISDAPSPWVFAADTVLQLGVESRERGRWIEVKKHRFGPSATGRHELELMADRGPSVFPAVRAWYERRRHRRELVGTIGIGQWPQEPLGFFGSSVLVSGDDIELTWYFASTICPAGRALGADVASVTLAFEFVPDAPEPHPSRISTSDAVFVPTNYGSARALRNMLELLEQRGKDGAIDRVLIGDLAVVLADDDNADWAAALSVFVAQTQVLVIAWDSRRSDMGPARATLKATSAVGIEITNDGRVHARVSERLAKRVIWRSWDPPQISAARSPT